MKKLKDYKRQFDDLMKDIEQNTNSSEARIKLPEAIAGIQYHYAHASYKLAKSALAVSILAIIISIIISLQIPTRLPLSHSIDVKEKMAFEGIINNYIQRIKAKDDFPFMFEFDYWVGALINNEIDVYIYVRPPVSIIDERYPVVKKEVEKQFNKLKRRNYFRYNKDNS